MGPEDWVANSGPGYGGGALIFGTMLLAIVAAWGLTGVSRVGVVLGGLHPDAALGATIGDFLDKPVAQGGFDVSRSLATLILAVLIVPGILILPQRAGRHPPAFYLALEFHN